MGRSTIENDLVVGGHLTANTMTLAAACVTNANVAASAAIERAKLEQNTLQPFDVSLTELRVWDALSTNLPATGGTDDLGLYGNTFGSSSPQVATGDVKAAGTTTRRARVLLSLPPEYDAGETLAIRLHAGMETTVADTSATIDVEAYKSDGEGGIGSDLCATAAQSINSVTYANKDFTITPSGLVAGDVLDVRVTMVVVDAATGTAVNAAFGKMQLLADIRG